MLRSPTAALVVLTLINLFNYIDRYVFSAVKGPIKESLDLHDWQLGVLFSSFIWVYMLASPIFGRLGDTRARSGIIATGVGLWSVATALAGLSRGFGHMFGARAAVGIGEAAYGSISPSVLADHFPKEKRGRVFAIFFSAIPIGSALGYVIGGWVEARWGWRAAFYVAGLPGLLLAALAFLLRDPPRGEHDPDDVRSGHAPGDALAAYRTLLGIRPYVVTVLGYAAYTWALGGLADWMPEFLRRVRGETLEVATTWLGAITVAAGFLGTFAGGWAGDRLQARGVRQAYLLVSGVATAVAVPLSLAALTSPERGVYYAAFFATEFFLFVSTSPINALIVNLVPVDLRATAVALSIFAIHLLGDAISPTMIGGLSDALGGDAAALGRAVLLAPIAIAASAAIWIAGAVKLRGLPG